MRILNFGKPFFDLFFYRLLSINNTGGNGKKNLPLNHGKFPDQSNHELLHIANGQAAEKYGFGKIHGTLCLAARVRSARAVYTFQG